MKVARIQSGIPGLDKKIQGGFKKNSINLIAGEPGAGKTIFALQKKGNEDLINELSQFCDMRLNL